jgi:hypothetical protein
MKIHKISILMLMICLGAALAHAATSPTTNIDISFFANSTWCGAPLGGFINCSKFPYGEQTCDGIPFLIPGNAQGTANNIWHSAVAAGGGSGPVSIPIPVKVPKVKRVYTLMNTYWGPTASDLLTVTFTGSAGATWTSDLIGGTNIGDYNDGSYSDTTEY